MCKSNRSPNTEDTTQRCGKLLFIDPCSLLKAVSRNLTDKNSFFQGKTPKHHVPINANIKLLDKEKMNSSMNTFSPHELFTLYFYVHALMHNYHALVATVLTASEILTFQLGWPHIVHLNSIPKQWTDWFDWSIFVLMSVSLSTMCSWNKIN